MRVVLDTNVLVSGVLSPVGPPGLLLDLVLARDLTLIVEPRVVAEYRDVLARPRFRLDPRRVELLIDTLEAIGIPVVGRPWPASLPDPDDEVFLGAAAAGEAVLVTGNLVDYPEALRLGIAVWSPRECLDRLRAAR
jgi:putative PIN family toxin of toxin-antitoxin system